MECREGCGACCIAWSISSPIPGMSSGKPAGERCVQLDQDYRCRLFGHPDRPTICNTLAPARDFCGDNREQAMTLIAALEIATGANS